MVLQQGSGEASIPFPLASCGAFFRHDEHNLEEHGISCLRYSSLVIFCTFPLFVDLTKTLLDIFEALGSAFKDLLRLVIIFFYAVRESEGQGTPWKKASTTEGQ